MKILGVGLSGLVGSRIVELLQNKHSFEDISYDTGVDIIDKQAVTKAVQASSAQIIFHLAAKANVDACEEDKSKGKMGDAWRINVEGTRNVVDAAVTTGKRIIYISTDFVFDGEETLQNGYREDAVPNPLNWYAVTKYEGEKIVAAASVPWAVLRIAYPYRSFFPRNDFVRAILTRLQKGEVVHAVEDHVMSPTFIDDLASAINMLIERKATGIYHVVGSQFVTPYQAALAIAETFSLPKSLIAKTTRDNYFAGRAKRPFRLALNNDKIEQLGVRMRTFEEGLLEVRSQINNSK
ncbi:MAG: SDR family oxidoreductase [Candidatus Levybacteria bacterium]|nr:SDR family oxidoreductase [Candidatus Levybacteria bacterium]